MIAERIGQELRQRNLTIAVAESVTGGLISDMITDVPGASSYFIAGIIAYSDRIKIDLLDVKEETLRNHGAVSAETAKEMAKGVRRISGADIGLSSTGIAGPGGGTAVKPVGLVHFAVDFGGRVVHQERIFRGDRKQIKERASEHALEMVLSILDKNGQ